MSTWVTPAGTIGTYTQQREFQFTFQASPSLGGVINYELIGSWPPGTFQLVTVKLSPTVWVGVLTATPAYVSVPTEFSFTISATEITSLGATLNPRTFTMTVSNTVWQTGQNLGGYTELTPLNIQIVAEPSIPGHRLIYSLLNGSLPAGQTVNTPLTVTTVQLPPPSNAWVGVISGTPGQVSTLTTSTFTVRATEYNGLNQQVCFRDRTFSIDISGTSAPSFVTPAGTTWVYYDSTWVYNQIEWQDPDPGNDVVITLASGNLPPGLEITTQGMIRGYADIPALASVQYDFTLNIKSASGENLAAYSIIINNQNTIPGFVGREPTILNTRPLTIVQDPNDPYRSYYLDSDDIGSFVSDNYFAFKIIGYSFDGQDLNYELIPSSALAGTGLTLDVNSGWITGTLASSPTPSVDTYNFAVAAYDISNPALKSINFQFSLTIVNNIDTRVVWVTPYDLGQIQNGNVSVLGVEARSIAGKNLAYRLVGNDFTSDLRTFVYNNIEFQSFGLLGGYVLSSDGNTWNQNVDTQLTLQRFNLLDSVYNPFTGVTVVVGNNVSQRGIFAQSIDGINWTYGLPPSPVPGSINGIAFNNDSVTPLYVIVGTDGFIATSPDATFWTVIAPVVSDDLTSIYYDGTQWVAVGHSGIVLYSFDTITWNQTSNSYITDFTSVATNGTSWVITGQLNTLIVGTSITNSASWVSVSLPNFSDLKSVTVSAGTYVVVGTNGTILTSTDDGATWQERSSNTFNDLYDVYYDSVITGNLWAVGDVGTILTSTDSITWTSPTISDLPPYLIMENDGAISGRLAFQPLATVTPANTSTVYEFTVQAFCTDPGFEEITSIKKFKLTTYQKFPLPYDNLYIKALVSHDDRAFIDSIINNTALIPEQDLFRPQDPYFGRARDVKYQHMFGVPSVASADLYSEYIAAVTKNHYWRNITLGPLKVAQARNARNELIYEVVYSEIIDNLINSAGDSISKEIIWPRNITLTNLPYFTASTTLNTSMTYADPAPSVKRYDVTIGTVIELDNTEGIELGMYMTGDGVTLTAGNPPTVTVVYPGVGVELSSAQPALLPGTQVLFNDPVSTSSAITTVRTLYPNSLPNMRQQIADTLGFINDPSILPLWMSGQQADGNVLGYVQAWVLCYTKPGQAQTIVDNINQYLESNNLALNQIDFKIDRFEIDRSQTYGFEGGTASAPVWSDLPSPGVVTDSQDAYIYFPQKTILPENT